MTLLVGGAEAGQDLAERGAIGRDDLTARHPAFQRHEVAARQEIAEVRGRVDGTAVLEVTHQCTILARRRVSSRGSGRLNCRLFFRASALVRSCGGPEVPASHPDR